nr:MAG TPA: hypothetical protein [Caudoviricetes sp.]
MMKKRRSKRSKIIPDTKHSKKLNSIRECNWATLLFALI